MLFKFSVNIYYRDYLSKATSACYYLPFQLLHSGVCKNYICLTVVMVILIHFATLKLAVYIFLQVWSCVTLQAIWHDIGYQKVIAQETIQVVTIKSFCRIGVFSFLFLNYVVCNCTISYDYCNEIQLKRHKMSTFSGK